jgi:transposase
MRREFTMAKRRNRTHSNEFREEAIRQVRESGKPLSRMALELGLNYSTLRAWVKEAESPPGERLVESERAELRRLRSEVRELRLEREILKKATAFFAKHSR